MEFEGRPCPICKRLDGQNVVRESNIDTARLTEASFSSRKLPEYMHCRLMKCDTCGLTYSSPTPKLDFIAESYRDASFDASEESAYAARTYIDCLREADLLQPVPTLDIGAGDGAFLSALMANGFHDVVGFEPSSAPIAVADPAVRERIRPEPFDVSQIEGETLGLITCFQTIEHVPDPLQLVTDMRRVLRPGGAAVLIAHNVDGLSAKVLGYKSPIFDIEHLQLLSPKSATTLMKTAGFDRILIRPIMNAYPVAYWVRLFPLPGPLKEALLRALKGPFAWLGKRTFRLPVGNMVIVASK